MSAPQLKLSPSRHAKTRDPAIAETARQRRITLEIK